ncbi:hypothetical protein F4678DRAFT_451215 [Xylaria arbuscula]|nr:hypothetical protein F4678DRAFT_451215 [Xylaria arbuscula]
MSNHGAPSTSFGAIEAHTALAGNNFFGPAAFTNHNPQAQSDIPKVCHSIPFQRNEDLVVRSAVANKLNELLPGTPGYRAAALWGLGGSGKTQIALEYAYSRKDRDHHCSVFWVHADSDTSFAQDYHSIAKKLGLPENLAGKDLLQAVCDQLEEHPNWVLVIDNADDVKWFGVKHQTPPNSSDARVNLNTFIPKCSAGTGTGTVLWTSRDEQIRSLVGFQQAIPIIQMTSQEAEALLGTIRQDEITHDEYEAVGELLAELDHLPLAISQAAAYMRKTATSVRDYLSNIRSRKERRWRILGNSEHDRHRREQGSNSVLETWDISVEHLRKENELIYDILHCLAFVNNQNIPFELIMEAALISNHSCNAAKETFQNRRGQKHCLKRSIAKRRKFSFHNTIRNTPRESQEVVHTNNENSNKNSTNAYDIKEITSRLCQFSFLAARPSDPDGLMAYDMHKLVQEAARYRLQKGEDEVKGEAYFAKTAFQITDRLFPNSEGDFWDVQVWGREVWGRCEQYLPHALHAGTWAELHGGEVQVANLLDRLSHCLGAQARWREKEAIDHKCLQFRRKALGDRHLDTLGAMSSLAGAYGNQGKWEEAEELYQKTIHLQEEVLGKTHPDTLRTMNNLASLRANQGDYAEAEVMTRKALEHLLSVLGKKHPDILLSMRSLGIAINNQGRHEEAEDILRQVLQLRTEVLGKKHPDTIDSMENLGIVIGNQRKHEEAEDILRQVLQLRTEVLGQKHPDTLASMDSLGVAINAQGRYEEAERILRQALNLNLEVQGRKMDPYTLDSMNKLAVAINAQGRHEEAERILRQALKLNLEVRGRKHPETLRCMRNISWALRQQGKDQEAAQLARDFETGSLSVVSDADSETSTGD